MSKYKKRNRKSESEVTKTAKQDEQELVLRLTKDELLDKHVLLPHAEVNGIVYDAVNQFVEKYSGESMTLTIMSDAASPIVQDVFKESYRSHYEDEYRKISRYLKRRYWRMAALILVIIAAFWCSSMLAAHTNLSDVLLGIISQIGVFCLWEIGYTHFDRTDAAEEKNRIVRARDATIQFQCRK